MTRAEDIAGIVIAAHALTRVAAVATRNDAPATQWRALSILQNEGPQRIGELARASRTTQPGVTRLVGQLDEAGLVRRDGDPEDSRVTLVTITDAGAAAIDAWRAQLGEALAPLFADLDDDEWSALEQASRILASRAAVATGAGR
ncbi:MarR family winged helix-turn-helix transcriptional regulator [Microbacterium sp. 18062]|uniref:MarR family winged helix-turn-helix transcriptional regulator n=1 Tax=Microbacterium sp. 18062 TaxID=2681410 RepID=UPI00135A587C|nr:MarR family transcriptional regulator [Microbacterium sp. 18062]